jgi:hypothetical protein
MAQKLIKGIVSQDLEVCFLIRLDSSDSGTPNRTGSFLLLGQFRVEFLIIRSFAVVIFPVIESWLRDRPQLIS